MKGNSQSSNNLSVRKEKKDQSRREKKDQSRREMKEEQ